MVTDHVKLVTATLCFSTISSDFRQKCTNVCNVLQNPLTHCIRCIQKVFLPTVVLIKDHLVNQEKGEVKYFLLSSIQPQVNRLLFSLTGISTNILEIVYGNVQLLNNAFLQQPDLPSPQQLSQILTTIIANQASCTSYTVF